MPITPSITARTISREKAWRISGKKGVDVCVNFTGGDTWNSSIRTLKPHGKLLTCGATAGFDAQDLTSATSGSARSRSAVPTDTPRRTCRRGMIDMAEGKIKRPEVRELPRRPNSGEAEAVMESRDFFGKIVMIP